MEDPIDSPAQAGDGRRLRTLVIAPSLIASVTIGVIRPLHALAKARALSLRLRFEHRWRTDDLVWADVVVFCRNQSEDALTALYLAKHYGKRIIFEVDDNFFEIPLSSALGRAHRGAAMLHVTRRFFEMADVTRVYTPLMRELADTFGANVHQIRSYFDAGLIKGLKPGTGGRLKIAFATGRTPDPRLDSAIDQALLDVLRERTGQVEVHFWRRPARQLARRKDVIVNTPIMNYEKFIRRFYRTGYAIGIAPLAQTRFQESKTNNKYREYGGCGVAGIYSVSQPYVESVEDGRTGLLVDNSPASWRTALLRLIDDRALRDDIAANARAHIARDYGFAQATDAWVDSLNMALQQPARPEPARIFLHPRNIVTDNSRLGSSVANIRQFPSTFVRGSEWNKLAVFPTRVVNDIASAAMLAIPGARSIQFVTGMARLNKRALIDVRDGDIVLVVDARRAGTEEVGAFVDLVRGLGLRSVILLLSPLNAEIAEMSVESALARTHHEHYPHEVTVPLDFGRVIFARQDQYLFRDYTLQSGHGLWMSIMDAASMIVPKGREPEREHWILRASPPFLRRLMHRRLAERNVVTMITLAATARINALRFQYARYSIKVEPAAAEAAERLLRPPAASGKT